MFREKRSIVVMVASKLFMEKGYHQTSIRDISRATGMSMGNLYRYISDKEELLYLVLDRYHHRIKNVLFDRKGCTKDDPKKTLKQFISNHINQKSEYLEEVMVANCESRFLSNAHLKEVRLKEMENIHELEKILGAGACRGVFNVSDPYLTAVMMMHQLNILATKGWMVEEGYTEKDVDTFLEDYVMKAISRMS